MTLPLVFHPDVRDGVDEAYQWYEKQRTGLGESFLEALDQLYPRLQAIPEVHQMIYRDVRRSLLRRFPCAVYYRSNSVRVEVIAVQHCRRDPSRWQSRV